MINLSFTKMTGAGNDFVVIDNREHVIHDDLEKFARRVSDRRFGVGSDGLLLLEPSSHADFLMRYFNADGSIGAMCGNGGRCIAKFAHNLGIVPEEMKFEAVGFVYRASVRKDTVRLSMKNPTRIESMTLQIDGKDLKAFYVDTGAPHVVLFSDELGIPLDEVDVDSIGRMVRWHEKFQPYGTNVNVVQLLTDNRIYNRTFERGVEGETLACGTGSVATALVVAAKAGLTSPVDVQTKSGQMLVVDFKSSKGTFIDVVLQGDARVTFMGQLKYDDSEKALV